MCLETIKPHLQWHNGREQGALTRLSTPGPFDFKAMFLEVILSQVIHYLLGIAEAPPDWELECIPLGRRDSDKCVCAAAPPGTSLVRYIPEASCFPSPRVLFLSASQWLWHPGGENSHWWISSCLLAEGLGVCWYLSVTMTSFFSPLNCIKPLNHGGKWAICMLLEFV